MIKKYPAYPSLLTLLLLLVVFATSCKKESSPGPSSGSSSAVSNYATIGLYEAGDGTNRRLYTIITQVGTAGIDTAVQYATVFDTGSTGMTIDAHGIIPASMFTNNGFVFSGDSTVVNGITITSQSTVITYGGVGAETKEYGNLAYAIVKFGGPNGSVTTTRIPFFLYYKAVDVSSGKNLAVHSNDVFGVASGTSFVNSKIGSPLSYFPLASGVTNAWKLGLLPTAGFASAKFLTYEPNLLTIGLTPTDLNSSGFIMHPLTFFTVGGYSPDITGTIVYNGTTVAASILLDTGTPQISILENPNATTNVSTLAANGTVQITTPQGFTYSYTVTSTFNSTAVEKTSYSQDTRTIFSIDFFISNEYLMDYANHQIGLKNN